MKQILSAVLLAALSLGGFLGLTGQRPAPVIPPVEQTEPAGPYAFDFAFLAAAPREENCVLSPFSLKMALALAANGAGGQTRQEILDALGVDDLDAFNRASADFMARYAGEGAVEIDVANSIWHNTDFYGDLDLTFAEAYRESLRTFYAAEAASITNATGATKINGWVAEKTKGKITELVNDLAVRGALSILVNTVYFKGDWSSPFQKADTVKEPFHNVDGTETATDLMSQTGWFHYYEDGDFQILALPYEEDTAAMYLVLPKSDAPLTGEVLAHAVTSGNSRLVHVKLPKFKTESLHETLTDTLKGMGVTAAFDDAAADFWAMYTKAPAYPPYIGAVLQKAVIEVDETGSVAAAATGIVMTVTTSAPARPEVIDFFCNRPFTYLIRESASGEILFLGQHVTASDH